MPCKWRWRWYGNSNKINIFWIIFSSGFEWMLNVTLWIQFGSDIPRVCYWQQSNKNCKMLIRNDVSKWKKIKSDCHIGGINGSMDVQCTLNTAQRGGECQQNQVRIKNEYRPCLYDFMCLSLSDVIVSLIFSSYI